MPSTRRALPFLLFALAAAPPSVAAPPSGPNAWCGTEPATLQVLAARHVLFERQHERERLDGRLPLKSTPLVYQVGNVAVIEDDGTIVSDINPFDLEGRSMQFLRRPKGMSAVRSPLDVKQLIGDKLTIGDDASVRVDFPANFTFPFGDRVYTSVWINSDGNLTFGAPDFASTSRSLQRFLNGPPRIAPLFVDLDPSTASGANGVYVAFLPHRVRITWLGVPLFGVNNSPNTFQVTLFDTGRTNFAYGEIFAGVGVVGVAPFGPLGLELLDYDEELPFGPPQRVAIAEEFTSTRRRDDLAAASTFLRHYEDRYDHLIFWLDFRSFLSGAFAFEQNVKNEVSGIGLPIFDASRAFGSDGALRSFVMMGDLSRYPDDPDEIFLGTNSTMGILGQEAGHRWLAFVRFIDGNGARSTRMLGRDLAHWSFHLNSQGSVMEGNDLADNGDGTFTSTARATTRFSELDQYLMGLRPPQAVSGFFYVDNATGGNAADAPVSGFTFSGDRIDVSVNDVIAAEGPRRPPAARADRSFRMAFIVIGDGAQPVPQETIDKVERFRARWVDFFQDATNNRGTVRTALFPK